MTPSVAVIVRLKGGVIASGDSRFVETIRVTFWEVPANPVLFWNVVKVYLMPLGRPDTESVISPTYPFFALRVTL